MLAPNNRVYLPVLAEKNSINTAPHNTSLGALLKKRKFASPTGEVLRAKRMVNPGEPLNPLP